MGVPERENRENRDDELIKETISDNFPDYKEPIMCPAESLEN